MKVRHEHDADKYETIELRAFIRSSFGHREISCRNVNFVLVFSGEFLMRAFCF